MFVIEYLCKKMAEMSTSQTPLASHHEPSNLSNLPAELVLKILENLKVLRDPKLDHINAELDRITSTCLGLTCKSLYQIHKALHPQRIRLHGGDGFPPEFSLAARLRTWMPPGLVYNHAADKFVTPQRNDLINREENRKEAARWRSISRAETMPW